MPELVPLPGPSDRIDGENWRDALGDGRRVGDWVAHCTREVTERAFTVVMLAAGYLIVLGCRAWLSLRASAPVR